MELTSILATVVFFSILIEAIIDTLKYCVNDNKVSSIIIKLIAIILGMIFCAYYKVDITYLINKQFDLIGALATGIVASRGSNFVYELMHKLTDKKE